eukprot:PhM_4_TR3123/c0_g1_i1/m.2987
MSLSGFYPQSQEMAIFDILHGGGGPVSETNNNNNRNAMSSNSNNNNSNDNDAVTTLRVDVVARGFGQEEFVVSFPYRLFVGHSEFELRRHVKEKLENTLRDNGIQYNFFLKVKDTNMVVDEESYEFVIDDAQATNQENNNNSHSKVLRLVATPTKPVGEVLTAANLSRIAGGGAGGVKGSGAVAEEAAIRRRIPELNERVGRWSIKARAMEVHYEQNKITGSQLFVQLKDASGCGITGKAYGDTAQRLQRSFVQGNVYIVSFGVIQQKTPKEQQLCSDTHTCTISFRHTTTVVSCPEDSAIPAVVSAHVPQGIRSFGGNRPQQQTPIAIMPQRPSAFSNIGSHGVPTTAPLMGVPTPSPSSSSWSGGASVSSLSAPRRTPLLAAARPYRAGDIAASIDGGGAPSTAMASSSTTSTVTHTFSCGVSGVVPMKRVREDDNVFVENDKDLLHRHDVRTRRDEHELGLQRLDSAVTRTDLCALCGIDYTSDPSVEAWVERYKVMCRRCNLKPHPWTVEEWQNVLEDKLGPMAADVFYDDYTNKPFFVHTNCALVAWRWQTYQVQMEELPREASLSQCVLCGEMGAATCCYHPDCDKLYHISCAYFSNTHVTWGTRPEWRLVPQCPVHMDMKVRKGRKGDDGVAASLDTSSKEEYTKDIRRLTPYEIEDER